MVILRVLTLHGPHAWFACYAFLPDGVWFNYCGENHWTLIGGM